MNSLEVVSKNFTFCIPSGRSISNSIYLIDQLVSQGFSGEILIAKYKNDSGLNSSYEQIQKYNNARIIVSENPSASLMRNALTQHVKTEFIVFLDDDLILDENYLKGLCEVYFSNKHEIVQGCPYKTTNYKNWFARNESLLYKKIVDRMVNCNNKISICDARNLVIKTDIISKHPFNGKLAHSGEGQELADNLISNGYSISYANNLIIYHFNRDNLKDLFKQKIMHGVGRIEKLSGKAKAEKLEYLFSAFYRHFINPIIELVTRKNTIGLTSYILLTNTFFWFGKIYGIYLLKLK